MKFIDLVKIVWRNMWQRKARTIFTMAGVIIGCLAVFMIASISNGFKIHLEKQMNDLMDTSVITIYPFGEGMVEFGDNLTEESGESEKVSKLNDTEVSKLENLPFISKVNPIKTAYAPYKFGDYEGYAGLQATNDFNSVEIITGRLPRVNSKEVLIGYEVAKELLKLPYDVQVEDESIFQDLVGKTLKLGNPTYVDETGYEVKLKQSRVKITGVLKKTSSFELMYAILAPEKLVDEQIMADPYMPKKDKEEMVKSYERIEVSVTDKKYLEEYENELKSMGYNTSSFIEFENNIQNIITIVSVILGLLAGVSLIVATFGITNTMEMAIYERNKEIGIIKVIGGSVPDVKKIFVGEACAISLTGGTIAIILGFIIDIVINLITKSVSEMAIGVQIDAIAIPTFGLIIGIMLFSLGIGFIAGILPAKRATKIDVISAIK